MHTTTPPKRATNTLTITIDQTRIARGHSPHRTGAGVMADRRTRRNRTRNARNRTALREW